MTIREATPDDAEAIHDVARASWETDYPDILSRETIDEGVEEWYATDGLRRAIADSRTRLFVAVEDGAVVGFVHGVLADGGEGDVLRLYVHPEHRRQGTGHELLRRLLDDLDEHGADRINAMALAENDPGNAFYRSFGFEKVAEHETTIGGESVRENTFALERG